VEQRLDQNAETDEDQELLVVDQDRLDEAVDRRERAGGFLGGKDDEILVVIIVVELQLVVLIIFVVIVGRRAGRLAAGNRARRTGSDRKLLLKLRIVRRRGIPVIRRRRLWRHETNRCCTAGMTANRTR
jgi:hypothetical protein